MNHDAGDWTTGTVVADGTRLAFHRAGHGGRPTLLLLHGITDDGRCWSRVATRLEERFEILMPDARGHGQSARISEPVTLAQLAADAAAILDGLGCPNAVVWGHSLGAATAIELAATRPDLVRAMVLEDPPLDPPPMSDELRAAIRTDAARWPAMDEAERHAQASLQNPGWGAEETAPWADAKAHADPALMEHMMALGSFDWRRRLSEVRCPGLLVTGDPERHALVTPEVAAEAITLWPGGRLLHITGAGHSIHRDRWEAALGPIEAFLEETPA